MHQARTILAAALASSALLTSPGANAAVRDDVRSCQYGYWKQLKRGAVPPASTQRDQQYCTALAYWFQPSPLPRDPAKAAQSYAAAAKQGHVGSMVALAYQYERGQGVPQDMSKAVALYRQAADLGSPDGMFNMFRAYTTGKGVGKPDATKAQAWLERAAGAGSLDAKKALASQQRGASTELARQIEAQAFDAYKRKDFTTSLRLYRQAADQGNKHAMTVVGQHHAQGIGTKVDLTEAARWYKLAAEKGDPAGQAQLGFAYENGDGVPENWAEMRRWCELSAAQVHPLGMNCVGRLYQFGMAVPMNRAKAVQWFDRAADQDNPWARWSADWLRDPKHCVSYRNAKERETFFGVCVEPRDLTFRSSRERSAWLRARYNELEAEALRDWGKDSGFNRDLCRASGGEAHGNACFTPGGRVFDPMAGQTADQIR